MILNYSRTTCSGTIPVKLFLMNHKNNNQLTLYTDYNLLIYKSEMSLICHPYTKEWTLEDHPTKC